MAPAVPSALHDTPNIKASEAVLSLYSSTRIAAPASLVFRTLRNTDTWRDWNPWVPRVVISYQPPDDDNATADEIAELVRNTSIAGSFDSDLTDGLVGKRRKVTDNEKRPDTPPLKLRSKSNASHFSAARSNSEASEFMPTTPTAETPSIPNNDIDADTNTNTNGNGNDSASPTTAVAATATSNGSNLSAAQRYAAAQEQRRASVKPGDPLPPVNNNVLTSADPFLSPTSATSNDGNSRRKSAVEKARTKANTQMLLQLYGEPSVRIQIHTKMTFFIRMNPRDKSDTKYLHVVVTQVSRPDDPTVDGDGITPLTRSKTHTAAEEGADPVYRIVWTIDPSKSSLSTIKSGSAYPKSLLQAERVHEIRPIKLGNGTEECEYRQWELQKGPVAKLTKKKYEGYMQVMMERWGSGIGSFCEGMGGKVDRRDFSVDFTNVTEHIFTK